jgi:hypothetical protein
MRAELESFEFNLTRTGKVSYSAPAGSHDDTVVALALAFARLDGYRTREIPSATWADVDVQTVKRLSFSELRKDDDFGF